MTTAAVTVRARAVPAAARRPGLPGTLRSELTKIVSVRSTYWTLLAQVLASIGWAIANCAGLVSHGVGPGFNPAEASLTGQVALGELIIVVLGALVITSEYSTGMIRTSLAVMPRRGVLYAGKAMVFAAVTFALSLVTSFTSFFIGQAILSSKHYNTTLTTFDLDEYAFAALRAGASGFLLKSAPPEELLYAIRSVHNGDSVVAPSTTRRLIGRFMPHLPAPGGLPDQQRLAELTVREREVLAQVGSGLSNAEIAALLHISEATVKTHVGHIMAKLSLRDRIQVVVYAYETGLITPQARS